MMCNRYIPNQPVHPGTGGSIGIFYNNGQAFGLRRYAFNIQRGTYIFSIAGISFRYQSSVLKGGAADTKRFKINRPVIASVLHTFMFNQTPNGYVSGI
jgi:hypothetical protein